MSNIRNMVDAISGEDFNGARGALKASLAEYMAGKKYLSNEEVFGKKYINPNKEEQELKAKLSESEAYQNNWECTNGHTFKSREDWPEKCPECDNVGDDLVPMSKEDVEAMED